MNDGRAETDERRPQPPVQLRPHERRPRADPGRLGPTRRGGVHPVGRLAGAVRRRTTPR
jgi:hypothetical protein